MYEFETSLIYRKRLPQASTTSLLSAGFDLFLPWPPGHTPGGLRRNPSESAANRNFTSFVAAASNPILLTALGPKCHSGCAQMRPSRLESIPYSTRKLRFTTPLFRLSSLFRFPFCMRQKTISVARLFPALLLFALLPLADAQWSPMNPVTAFQQQPDGPLKRLGFSRAVKLQIHSGLSR